MSSSTLSLLQDAEGNHCSSFPAELLKLVQSGARLLHADSHSRTDPPTSSAEEQALCLLRRANRFDPLAWARSLQSRSPQNDHSSREHIAFAHRAAACIYLSRVLLSFSPTFDLVQDLEALVTDIVYHLSFVRPGDALLTASTWPAFIAGAETWNVERRAWVMVRYQELFETELWGLFRGAMEVLEGIWERKAECMPVGGLHSTALLQECNVTNWLDELRNRGVDWLII